ncbi:MAG: cytochrome-c peroxidase [Myxococcaceae bacterium]|nr:cytochrome-c peroxidase [Myxococcaceae bacterium]MCI0669595.1 cytochrome-c peroxidase [Myxococcaceae bacterium]
MGARLGWGLACWMLAAGLACDARRSPVDVPPPGQGHALGEEPPPEEAVQPTREQVLRTLAPPSLKNVQVPRPANLAQFVRDEAAAVALGKAFFWDMQVGSDGQMACATCHFHAGADARVAGSIFVGPNGESEHGGASAALSLRDFPLHRRANPDDPASLVVSDSDDVVGSQGVPRRRFVGLEPGTAVEQGSTVELEGTPVDARQVTPRNSPSVINSVFNFRNFWDGRASHFFNGESPFGVGDAGAGVWVDDGAGLVREQVRLENASLASQAVGPPLNAVEMSWDGRTKPLLGRKLLGLRPLGAQRVLADDSVLGPLVHPSGFGLGVSYEALIQRAFVPRLWASAQGTPDGFSQVEANFALFWALALQLYQSTLVSDDTPFDRFMEGADDALTLEQKDGMLIFYTHGRCNKCHQGAEFTAASVANVLGEGKLVSRMDMANGSALYDTGFYNIGVRPPWEDVGLAGRDPSGNPLAYAWRVASAGVMARLDVCTLRPEACPMSGLFEPSELHVLLLPKKFTLTELGDWLRSGSLLARPALAEPPFKEALAVEGTFKTPGLRNVELTGPYMHNGGMVTLGQVMQFYNRGGDFPAENRATLDAQIPRINLENGFEQAALVAFMKALTDERVRLQKAPFDHPELVLPDGQRIPAVGAGGGPPLLPFEQLLGP